MSRRLHDPPVLKTAPRAVVVGGAVVVRATAAPPLLLTLTMRFSARHASMRCERQGAIASTFGKPHVHVLEEFWNCFNLAGPQLAASTLRKVADLLLVPHLSFRPHPHFLHRTSCGNCAKRCLRSCGVALRRMWRK